MSEKHNLQINVVPTGQELIIRHGEAVEQGHKQPINLTGTLGAPFQFLEGKLDNIDFLPNDCHLQIFKDKGEIILVILDQHPFSKSTITGVLQRDNILNQFKINTSKRWVIQEFLNFIKTMRYYFADKAQHANLIKSLQKWQVKVERVITEFNDQKGNSNFQLQTKVQQSAEGPEGLLNTFDLNIPLFQGYSKVKFKVEIGLDPRNTSVELFLISDELIELEISQREKLLDEEIEKFKDFHCSKVVIS